MLDPLKCPRNADQWEELDQEVGRIVVPAVLSASTVDEKNHALCAGIYHCISSKYGTCIKGKSRYRIKGKSGQSRKSNNCQNDLKVLKEERNKTRNELRQAKRHGLDGVALKVTNSINSSDSTG